MALANMEKGIALILLTMLWSCVSGQSNDCTSVMVSMSPCLNYIQGNSSTPSSGCCTQFSSVVQSQPQCLCELLTNSGSSIGLNINQTQALALPGACNVQTPPISQCNVADSPAGTPSSTVPPTGDGSSDASSTKLSMLLLFFLLATASFMQ